MSLKEQKLPPIATLRATAALKSPHLSQVRPARIGLGFENAGGAQKTLAELEAAVGGPGLLSLPYSLRLLLDAMAGLGVLHRTLSVVHGEVQPEHVVLGEDGVGRLIPVVPAHWMRGLERAPERLYYLAPEKLLGDKVDARSDVFSVGVMLWEAISGQQLLDAHDVNDIIARLMGGGIPKAHAPEGESWTEPLATIAERAIAVDPARRFATIAEMRAAIEGACQRYLASTPGMVELFQDPARRARNSARDSVAPDSQRITLPPHQAPATIKPRALSDGTLDRAAAKLARTSFAEIDLEEELTTKPNAAPLPVASRRPHVSTLLGGTPPFVERDSSPPEELTTRFMRVAPSVPVLITPLPQPPSSPVTTAMPSARVPSRSATPLSFPPPPANRPPSGRAMSDSQQAASLSPLVAARTAPLPAVVVAEPSFELVRPRKRRGALWLVLGAAAAVALFAARPWLFEQLNASADAGKEGATIPLPQAAAATPPNVGAPSLLAPSAQTAVGIASTPPSPVSGRGPGRARGSREDHVIIHDTIDPSIELLRSPPPPQAEAAPPPPAAEPPPPPPPPPPEPAPAKTKSVPVSEADRYGI